MKIGLIKTLVLISLCLSFAESVTAADTRVIRLDYAKKSDAPIELQEALNVAFDKTKSDQTPISFYFSLSNDLNLLRVFGVQKNSDDYGYTHGLEFKIIGDLPNDYVLTLNYNTDLYTAPLEGELSLDPNSDKVKQYFTNENILKMVIEHKPENKLFFWKAEAGWIELNSEIRKNYLNGSTQQKVLHKLLNSASAGTTKDPISVDNGKGTRDGLLMGVYFGLAKSLQKDSDLCKKTLELQAGLRNSTIAETQLRTLEASIALDCGFRFTRNRFRIESGYQVTEHENGSQKQQYFDFSTKRKKWKFGFRVENNSDDPVNYVDYNLPNIYDETIDPIFKIYTQRDLN